MLRIDFFGQFKCAQDVEDITCDWTEKTIHVPYQLNNIHIYHNKITMWMQAPT